MGAGGSDGREHEPAGGDALEEQPPDRLVEFIRTDQGSPIAVVIADPALARYRGLFDAAVQTSGLALKNAQLQAKAAREKLEQVRASRARIVEAELAERRRLERDLHDGVQQHLLGITARLTVAMADHRPAGDRGPGPGPGRAQGGTGGAAGPSARNPPGRAVAEGPGRRAGGRGRAAPVAGPGDRSGHPGRHRGGGDRLLRRLRGARQRREARPGGQRDGYGERRGVTAGPRDRRRRCGRCQSRGVTGSPTSWTASTRSTGRSSSTARPAREHVSR